MKNLNKIKYLVEALASYYEFPPSVHADVKQAINSLVDERPANVTPEINEAARKVTFFIQDAYSIQERLIVLPSWSSLSVKILDSLMVPEQDRQAVDQLARSFIFEGLADISELCPDD